MVWLLGLGLLLAARIALTLDAPDYGLRLFTHSTGWSEADHPVLAAVVSQLTATTVRDAEIHVEGVEFRPLAGEDGWWEGVLPPGALRESANLQVTVTGVRREAEPLPLRVSEGGGAPSAMPQDYFQAPPAAAARTVRLMDATTPGLHWDGPGTHCASSWQAFADGGSPARFVPVELHLWLMTEAGPMAGVDVVMEPAATEVGLEPRRWVSDARGLVSWTTMLQGPERWEVSAPCPSGERGSRTLVVAPSWSTIAVRRVGATVVAGEPVRVQVTHQRERGRWVLGVSCGARWVGLETLPVAAGQATLELERLRWPRTREPRLCALHAAPSVARFREGVSTAVLLLPSPADEDTAWAMLHAVVTTRPESHWRALSPVLDALDLRVESDSREAVLDRLLVPPLRLPLMLDTREAWAQEHAAETSALRRRVDHLLLLQLLLLLGLGVPALWWAALQTRRRMQAVLEDDTDADEPVGSAAGGMLLPSVVLLAGLSAGATLIAAWRMLLYAMAG